MNRNERKKLTGQLGRQRSKASRPVLGENAKAPLSARLRRRADEHLRKQRRGRKPGAGRQEAGAETQQLVHELQVHQVELEMQNEELQQVRAKAHALLARYTDLYDFAPVGYLTLNEPGLILEANLTAAKLLGVARSKLLQQPLTRFILREDLDIFYQHRQQLFETRAPQSCELRLTRPGGAPFWVHGEAILAQDHKTGAPVCRVTLSDLTERKQAEEALRESEHLFRVLFEQAAVGVAQVRSDTGQFLRINQKYCEIVGYSREEMERLDFQTITHPDDLAGDLANMELLKAGKIREFTMEKRYFRKDGSLVWANLSVSPLWAPGEPPSSHVAVVEDITDRKRAENELILRNLRAQALLDLHQMSAAPREQILGFVQDASLRLTQSDYAFLGLLDEAESVMTIHRSSKQVMAQCALSGQPNCLPISGAGLWAECVRQRQPVVVNDYSAPHPGKKGMPAEQVLIRRLLTVPIFDGGRIVAVVAVANKPEEYALADTHTLIFLGSKMWEILRRQQAAADRERLAQFERLAQLMKCASDIILLADEHGRILEANDRALETYGYSLAELRQKTLEDLRTPESRAELPHQMEQLEMDGRAVFEAMNQRRDGAAFPVEISARFLEIAGVRYRLGIVRDISERKRAEEALRNREGVLQRIFDLLPVGLWFADKNGKLLRGNPAGVKIWGAEPKVSPSEYGVFKARRLPSGEEVAPDDWALAHTIRATVSIG